MKRALGVDHGDVRIGLALSDSLRMLASPLETIDRHRVAKPQQRIAALVAEHEVDTVVVGMPLHLDGGAGKAAAKVQAFLAGLTPLLPAGVEVVTVDERLTTTEATERLLSGGRRREFSRGQIDQAAAAVILQDYLDQHQKPALLPGVWNSEDEEWEEEEADEDETDDEEEEWEDEEADEDEEAEPKEGEWEDEEAEEDLGALAADEEEEWTEDDDEEDDWDDEEEDDEEEDDDGSDDDDDDDEWEDEDDDEDDDDEEEDEREDRRWGRVWDGFRDDD